MADLDLAANAEFALQRGYNLTGRLTHEKVLVLASDWLPEIRFHEKERFHPLDLPALFDVPPAVFAAMPEGARDAFRIERDTPTGPARFDPPLVLSGGGDVLGSGVDARAAPAGSSISTGSVYTHGDRLAASKEFFGASTTVAGLPEPAPGDPRVPRHPIVARAEMRFLFETLKHELERDRTIDALWGKFVVDKEFFRKSGPRGGGSEQPGDGWPVSPRDILRNLVAAHEAGDDAAFTDALADIPNDWELDTRAWNAVKGYAFLEFYFIYAYNDYSEYGDWPFDNYHECDVEGCCVVFERSVLEKFADGELAAGEVVPHTVITSVHHEFNDNDGVKRLPLERDRARDDLVVYPAVGSHATYLSPGSHDVLDFEDVVTDLPGEVPTWVMAIPPLALVVIVFAVILGIVEHFVDAEDETSDNGVSAKPGTVEPGGLDVNCDVQVTPLSSIADDVNIYQDRPGFRDVLALRAFPGTWGATDETVDFSSAWEDKTARYFRDFLRYGDIRSEVIT
jgi:hypothetical protein